MKPGLLRLIVVGACIGAVFAMFMYQLVRSAIVDLMLDYVNSKE